MAAKKGNKNALNNEGGRPPKIPNDLIKQATDYLQQCEDDLQEVITQSREGGNVTTTKKLISVNLPSIAGLARWLNVSRETIYKWQEAKIEFSDI